MKCIFKLMTVFALTATVLLSGCDYIGSLTGSVAEPKSDLSNAETRLNPGKSLFDMMKNLTFDGIPFSLPIKISDLPAGYSLLDESFIKTGDRCELLYKDKLAGFVIVKEMDAPEKATIDILSVDLVSSDSDDKHFDYCVFEVNGISFNGKKKADIELIFSDYTYTGDKTLLVYSFIDGSVIFNFDEKGKCNFIVIGGGSVSASEIAQE